MKNRLLNVVLVIGIIVSIYVTYVHYYPGALLCTAGKVVNCASVITSQYSVVLGIPLAVYSLIWFVLAFIFYRWGRLGVIADIWFLVGIGGMLYSFVAQYQLRQICAWCLTLDVLIVLSIAFYFLRKR